MNSTANTMNIAGTENGGMSSPRDLCPAGWPQNYFGIKKRLLQDIANLLPKGTRTFADLFAGTGLVSRYMRQRGFRTITNEIMRYPSLAHKVLLENNSTILNREEVDMLFSPNPQPAPYFALHYMYALGEDNCRLMDNFTSNIPRLNDPMKQAIATFIPILCLRRRHPYCTFHWSPLGTLSGGIQYDLFRDLESDIRKYAIDVFPSLLVKNGQSSSVHNDDAIRLIPKIEADVLYADVPYARAGSGNYEANYSFLDDLVRVLSGHGDEVVNPYDSKCELDYTNFGNRKSTLTGFDLLFKASGHIPHVLISYNDTSDVSPSEIAAIAKVYTDESQIKVIPSRRPSTRKGINTTTNEYLMLFTRHTTVATHPIKAAA